MIDEYLEGEDCECELQGMSIMLLTRAMLKPAQKEYIVYRSLKS